MTSVYVEWDSSWWDTTSDDGAEVYFSLDGTANTFQIQARAPSSNFKLQAYLDGIVTANNPQGSAINLGWIHDGSVTFILTGTPGNYWSSNTPPNWMQQLRSVIGNKPLRHVAIPGSHDAGMSIIGTSTAFANSENTQTQTQNLGTQLALGSRYFDLRPVISDGVFTAGHYSDVTVVGWQGADGQSLSDIINEINAFTATNKELIILNLSHDLNTDVGRDYRSLNQAEWNELYAQLSGINNLFVAPNPSTVDLSSLTVNQFIGSGQAAVVCIVQPSDSSISLGPYTTRGFYTYSQFNVYNNYSNTDNLGTMQSEQMQQLRSVRSSPDGQPFLLSWTLTQAAIDIGDGESILDLAGEANPTIYSQLLPAISAQTFPNILYIDDFADSSITALAVYINSLTR